MNKHHQGGAAQAGGAAEVRLEAALDGGHNFCRCGGAYGLGSDGWCGDLGRFGQGLGGDSGAAQGQGQEAETQRAGQAGEECRFHKLRMRDVGWLEIQETRPSRQRLHIGQMRAADGTCADSGKIF